MPKWVIAKSYSKPTLNFLTNCHTLSKWLVPLYITTSKVWMIQFLCILTNIWYHHSFLKFWNYFNRCIVIFHCGLNLRLHNSKDVEHLCMYSVIHISSLIKYVGVFCAFYIRLFFATEILGILYILDIALCWLCDL